eukprot:27666_4
MCKTSGHRRCAHSWDNCPTRVQHCATSRGPDDGLRNLEPVLASQVHLPNMFGWQVHGKPSRAGGGAHFRLEVSPRHAWSPVRQREPGWHESGCYGRREEYPKEKTTTRPERASAAAHGAAKGIPPGHVGQWRGRPLAGHHGSISPRARRYRDGCGPATRPRSQVRQASCRQAPQDCLGATSGTQLRKAHHKCSAGGQRVRTDAAGCSRVSECLGGQKVTRSHRCQFVQLLLHTPYKHGWHTQADAGVHGGGHNRTLSFNSDAGPDRDSRVQRQSSSMCCCCWWWCCCKLRQQQPVLAAANAAVNPPTHARSTTLVARPSDACGCVLWPADANDQAPAPNRPLEAPHSKLLATKLLFIFSKLMLETFALDRFSGVSILSNPNTLWVPFTAWVGAIRLAPFLLMGDYQDNSWNVGVSHATS